jgi:hypothetical protein
MAILAWLVGQLFLRFACAGKTGGEDDFIGETGKTGKNFGRQAQFLAWGRGHRAGLPDGFGTQAHELPK